MNLEILGENVLVSKKDIDMNNTIGKVLSIGLYVRTIHIGDSVLFKTSDANELTNHKYILNERYILAKIKE